MTNYKLPYLLIWYHVIPLYSIFSEDWLVYTINTSSCGVSSHVTALNLTIKLELKVEHDVTGIFPLCPSL